MPELPEVATVVSQLGDALVARQIVSVWSEWPKALHPTEALFSERVVGAHIIKTRRYGKHIVIDLNNHISIVIHLKMTGHLLIKNDENRNNEAFKDPFNQFIHHRIDFEDGTTLEFSDMRKFGWMEALETVHVEHISSIASLGIDALSPALTAKVFRALLDAKPHTKIGEFLLKQDIIAGIGNIYRSEALFQAKIAPKRLAGSLSGIESARLVRCIKKVLQEALSLGGMSDGDFRDTNGEAGRFQKILGVYGRHGKPCPKCATIIQRIKIGQRSAFVCVKCQH